MITIAKGEAWIKYGAPSIPIRTTLSDKGLKVVEEKKDVIEGSGYYLTEEHIGCMQDDRNNMSLHPRDFVGIKINELTYVKRLFE